MSDHEEGRGEIHSLAQLAAMEGLKLRDRYEGYSSHNRKEREKFKKLIEEGFCYRAGYYSSDPSWSNSKCARTAEVLLHVARPERMREHEYMRPKREVLASCVIPEKIAAYQMPLDLETLFVTPHPSPIQKADFSRTREPYPNLHLVVELLSIKTEKEKTLSDIALLKVLKAKPGMDTDDEGAVGAIVDTVEAAVTKDFTAEFKENIRKEMAEYEKTQIDKIRSAAPSEGVVAAEHAALDGGVAEREKEGGSRG
jgi:hypothetical protein